MTLSIVIPALDEEVALPLCLASAFAQAAPVQVIVVDGGSSDRTAAIARAAGATVVQSPRGRGVQMNRGAATATGDVLVFLHADSRLPAGAAEAIRAARARGVQGGAFTMDFDREDWSWTVGARLGDVFCRLTGDLFGDRAMFLDRAAFDRLGGFREDLRLMEDLDLSVRMRRAGLRRALLPGPVVTSGRRAAVPGVWTFAWRCAVAIAAFHGGRTVPGWLVRYFTDRPQAPAGPGAASAALGSNPFASPPGPPGHR